MNVLSVFPRHRVRVVAIIAAGVLAVGAIVTSIVVVSSNSASPSPVATQKPADEDKSASAVPLKTVPTPTSGPLSEDQGVEVQRATVAADGVVTALDEVSQRGDGSAVGVESIATGWVLGEVQAHAREQFDLGYTQKGTSKVTSVTPVAVDLAASPATITLKVCVDVSGIDIVDAAGNSLKSSLYNPGRPVAHIYGAVFEDNAWKISSHDIPDTQDCPAV